MICIRCRKEEFETREDPAVEQMFRGETFRVRGAFEACRHCGWRAVTDEQADQIARRTVDAYRRKHGLLTSAEIRAGRRRQGLSQAAFAELLEVSPISVKRWETRQVQEPIYDQRIRERSAMVMKGFGAWALSRDLSSPSSMGLTLRISLKPGADSARWQPERTRRVGQPFHRQIHDPSLPIAA